MTEQSPSRIGPVSPPPAYPEEIELYENDTVEPRYSSIQHMQTLKIPDGINLIENNIQGSMVSFSEILGEVTCYAGRN